MVERFRRGLSRPSELILYLKDSWSRVFLYLFLLIIGVMIPFFIVEYANQGLNSVYLSEISRRMPTELSGNYRIVNGQLDTTDIELNATHSMTIGLYQFHVTGQASNAAIVVYFGSNGLHYHFNGIELNYMSYTSLNMENFDFNDYSYTNVDHFVRSINIFMRHNQFLNKSISTGNYLLSVLFEFLFIIVLGSLFIRKPIAFKFKFKILVYCSTIYAAFHLLAGLYGITFLSLVGMVCVVLFAHRAFARLHSVE